MAPERTLTLTNPPNAAATITEGAMEDRASTSQVLRFARLAHIVTGALALLGAIATAADVGMVQLLERKAQTLFFELRGTVAPPDNIVILAIDEESLSIPEQYYRENTKQYAHLQPLQSWPWKREAYARAIDRLMAAGAKSVGVDIIFDKPSSYGTADDDRLRQTLQRHAGKITLAASYEEVEIRSGLGGSIVQLTQPNSKFWTKSVSIGAINYPVEVDGRIHRFASEFRRQLAEKYKGQSEQLDALKIKTPFFDFDLATLRSGQPNFKPSKGDSIHFYGPTRTFEHIPFWHVLEPEQWNSYLQQGRYFKDKIVLIGATASSLQDFHPTPFAKTWLYPDRMAGIEIHANAIATLQEGKAIGPAIPNALLQGLFVLVGVAGAGVFLSRQKQALIRAGWTVGIILAWGAVGYVTFVYGRSRLPTSVPMVAIALASLSYIGVETASAQIKKRQLRQTLARYATSPIVKEILEGQDDLQDLLPKQELRSTQLKTVIGGRYEIIKVLGSGGFGETYISRDQQRPGSPLCVVKHLKPVRNDPKHLELARRLFKREAEALESLGQHAQIPYLLAYFEEYEEFYLVQEFIPGNPLDEVLLPGKKLPETTVTKILLDLLQILEFVHSKGTIHRDIKPSNIIRRESDGKLVLIDFGAVKEINTQLMNSDGQSRFTVGIGTQGYAPNEQCAGRPRFNSDIYAVGMMAIQALTGYGPNYLHQDLETGEIVWQDKAEVSSEFAEIITKMVRYDFRHRYQSAMEVKAALLGLNHLLLEDSSLDDEKVNTSITAELNAPTQPWFSDDESTIAPE